MSAPGPNNIALPVPPVIAPPLAGPRPRVWPVFLIYVLALVLEVLVAAVVLTVIATATRGTAFKLADVEAVSKTPLGLLASVVCALVIIGVMVLAGASLSPAPWRERLRLRVVPMTAWSLVTGIAGILGIGLMLQGLDGLSWIPHSTTLEMLEKVLKGLSAPALAAAVVVIGVLPGIAEELLFRGYIQTRFAERWGSHWAIVWTSLMFGVIHLDPVQGSYAVLVGALLGYMTERTGSIVPAMICHAANNTIATLLTAGHVEFVGHLANNLALTGGVVVVVVSFLYLRSHLTTQNGGTAHASES